MKAKGLPTDNLRISPKPKGFGATQWDSSGLRSSYWTATDDKSKVAGFLASENAPMTNGMFEAVHRAFAYELKLKLAPGKVALAIGLGVAAFVNANTDACAKAMGADAKEGKKVLEIVTPSDNVDWEQTIQDFPKLIDVAFKSSPVSKAMRTEFTTTTVLERVARSIVLMDAYQGYALYGVATMCGITDILLTGTKEDWTALRDSITAYETLPGVAEWATKVKECLQKFVDAFDPSKPVDTAFWTSIYNTYSQSGGDIATGWIISICGGPLAMKLSSHSADKVLGAVGTGLSSVPFEWKPTTGPRNMRLIGGFGRSKVEDGVVSPTMTWAVQDTVASAAQNAAHLKALEQEMSELDAYSYMPTLPGFQPFLYGSVHYRIGKVPPMAKGQTAAASSTSSK